MLREYLDVLLEVEFLSLSRFTWYEIDRVVSNML